MNIIMIKVIMIMKNDDDDDDDGITWFSENSSTASAVGSANLRQNIVLVERGPHESVGAKQSTLSSVEKFDSQCRSPVFWNHMESSFMRFAKWISETMRHTFVDSAGFQLLVVVCSVCMLLFYSLFSPTQHFFQGLKAPKPS